jgi:hypothetical protein
MDRKKKNPPQPTQTPPQPRKRWHQLSPIIEEDDYQNLEERAIKVLAAARYAPTNNKEAAARDVFGDKYFTGSNSCHQATYYSKLRAFVKFHLRYPDYDNGIAIFYPYTPHHSLVGCDKAASHFLLMQFAGAGEEVMDHKVSGIFGLLLY